MTLKAKYAGAGEIPADLRVFYVERGGEWVLNVDGKGEEGKLIEFRDSNNALLKQNRELAGEVEALRRRFDGIDPDQVRKLGEEKHRLEEEKALKAGEVEKVFEGRMKALRTETERQVGALSAERDALNSRLAVMQIDQGALAAATRRGLRPTAAADVVARARGACRLVNGLAVVMAADGQTARVGKDGTAPMNLDEWVDSLTAEAPHLFESNAGSGAAGNGSGGAGGHVGGRNPYRKADWNLTEQGKVEEQDPAMAARMRAAAGS